jgi:hypothetical protein
MVLNQFINMKFFEKIKTWFKNNPCFLGHSDGEIVEYGSIQCVKKCDKCGEHYFYP